MTEEDVFERLKEKLLGVFPLDQGWYHVTEPDLAPGHEGMRRPRMLSQKEVMLLTGMEEIEFIKATALMNDNFFRMPFIWKEGMFLENKGNRAVLLHNGEWYLIERKKTEYFSGLDAQKIATYSSGQKGQETRERVQRGPSRVFFISLFNGS